METVRIGLALGGGFARGIAHAGAIAAAAYASGASAEQIAAAGCSMRFSDVGRWNVRRLGLVGSQCMHRFLERLLKTYRFEDMRIPLGVVATDLSTGEPVPFAGTGPVRRDSRQLLVPRLVPAGPP